MVDSNKENYVMNDKFDRIQSAIIKTQQRNYALYKGVNTVGRNKSAIINLKNLNVSQNHAVIVIVDETQHFVSDLNSSNGTYLLGTRLSPYKLYELVNDVELKFGDVTAFYSKVSRADTTIHLQSERNDMTQDMTQSYYGAGTQLMINDSLLNQTGPDNMLRKSNIDLEDIHEAETQVVVRVSANTDQTTENSNNSDTISDNDIHLMPTQAADYKLATTSEFTCDTHAGKTDEMNIHEMQTQVVNLPHDFDKMEEPEEMNIHDMQTQVLPRHLNEPEDKQEVNLLQEADKDLSEKSSESTTRTNEDVPKPESSPSNEKINSEAESNELFANMETSNVEETVIEETVIDETHMEMDVNEDSNGSIDFLTIQKPTENEQGRATNLANDNDSIISESQDIGVIRKRPPRKLSSSEDLTQSHNMQTAYNSDSDTDIENEIKASRYKTPIKEAIDSGSDTEIESDFQKQPKKKSKILSSDSETDVEESTTYNENPTKSSNVVINKNALVSVSEIEKEKRILEEIDADKEFLNDTDCIPATQDAFANVCTYGESKMSRSNPDSQNASSEESFKLGLTELMVESENKIDNTEEVKMNSEIDEEGTNHDKVADKSNEQLLKDQEEEGPVPKAIESKTDEELFMDPTQKICTDNPKEECERDILAAGHSKTSVILEEECRNEKPADHSKSSIPSETTKEAKMDEDDIYLMPTQKLNEEDRRNEDSPTTKKDNAEDLSTQDHNKNNEPEFKTPKKKYNFRKKQISLDWSLSNIFNKTQDASSTASPQKINKDEDNAEDIYLQPTQKLNEEPKTQDLYMQPTQKLNEEPKTQDLYMQPTQDLYMQPTQDLYMQPTQALKLTAAHNDDDFYMAPTQEINLEKVSTTESKPHSSLQANHHIPSTSGISKKTEENDEDLYMAATQPINPSLGVEEKDRKSVMDLYLQETQDLGLGNQRKVINLEQSGKHKERSEMQKPQGTELTGTTTAECIEKDVEDAHFAMTQPIKPIVEDTEKKKIPLESVTESHVQEASGPNEDENIEDPYMMPTQQINHDVVENSSVSEDNFKIFMPPTAVKKETSFSTKRRMRSDFNTPDFKRQKEVTDADSGKSTPTDTVIRKPLSKKKQVQSEASPSIQITKGKTTVDQSETLSQIQRFLVETSDHSKKPKAKTLPKKRTSTEAQIDAQSETLSQIEAFVKKPLTNIKETIGTPSKKRKSNKSVEKIEQPVEEFQKPERNVRSRRTKTTNQSKTHVSKEDCGISNDSEVGPSTSKDVETSFALLEAKSTKTRKSQRVVSSKEVKVALRGNRRSMATSAMPESSSDSESRPIKKSRKTSPNTRSHDAQNSSGSTSPEKGKRKQKPKVVFTMLDSPILETLIRQLGGSVVDSVEASTVLVTGQVKRSQKLLAAVGQGKPICSPEWIHASKKANEFLDPWDYILLDKEAESKWDFSLKQSLTRASNKKLLEGYTFQVIVDNAEDVLKGAIKACSGKCVPRCPAKNVGEKFLVIASPENKSKWTKIRKQHPQVRIVKPEAIFDGVLRQELRLDMHTLE